MFFFKNILLISIAVAVLVLAPYQTEANSGQSILEKAISPTFEESLENVRKEFPLLKKLTRELINRFPPDKFYYVALGRSVTPLMAMAELLGVESRTFIPMSNAKYFRENRRGVSTRTLEREENFFQHFVKFFPTKEELAGRSVLIIDYIEEGNSISLGKQMAEKILNMWQLSNELHMLALTYPAEAASWEKNRSPFQHGMAIKVMDERINLYQEAYKPFAPIAGYDLEKLEEYPYSKNMQLPAYERFKYELKEYLEKSKTCFELLPQFF